MALVTRVNLIPNPSFEYGLAGWAAFGGASISQVVGFFSYRVRVTMPTGGAGSAGARITIIGLTIGVTYRLWMSVPAASGATTYQFAVQGGSAGSSFATNDPLFKQGNLDFVATATSHAVQIQNANGSTSGDYADVEYAICEVYQPVIGNHAYFDGDTAGALWAGEPGNTISTFENYNTEFGSGALPMLIVEMDARPIGPNDFMLDRDSLDSTAVLVSSPRWYVVNETLDVAIRRGRQRDDSPMNPGLATITIDDYTGKYDPDNPATPLQIDGMPVMRAGMRIRVTQLVYFLGSITQLPLFTGSLDDVEIDRGTKPTTIITAIDDMAKLNTSAIPPFDPPIRPYDRTLWRAVWVLSFAGIGFWGASYGGNLDRTMLATAGGGNVGSALEEVANCEGGKVYAAADGTIKIGTHTDDFVTTVQATFTDTPTAFDDVQYAEIKTSTSIKNLINRCTVDRGGLVLAVSAQNDDSVALNKRVWAETVTAPLFDDGVAHDLAQWRADRRSRSATRVDSITADLTGRSDSWLPAAGTDIADVIRVKRYTLGRGIDLSCSVEGIDHTISRRGDGWRMTVYTSPLDITGLYADQPQPFRLDTSALDGADILTAF